MTRYAIIDLDRGVLTHRLEETQPNGLDAALAAGVRYGSLRDPAELWPVTAFAVEAVRAYSRLEPLDPAVASAMRRGGHP